MLFGSTSDIQAVSDLTSREKKNLITMISIAKINTICFSDVQNAIFGNLTY